MNKAALILILTLVASIAFSGAVSAQSTSNNVITGRNINIATSILSPVKTAEKINSGNSYKVRFNTNFVISRNINTQIGSSGFRSRNINTEIRSSDFRRII